MFKIFISSRNNDRLMIGGADTGVNLTDVRTYVKQEIEKEKLFGKDFFDIRINEAFDALALSDSYKTCLDEVRGADFFIALYNGVSGWAPTDIDLGICHVELVESLKVSSEKTAYINIGAYFPAAPLNDAEIARNTAFGEYVGKMNPFVNQLNRTLATADEVKLAVLAAVKGAIYKSLTDRIRLSNTYYDMEGNNKVALDWKKLKYADLERELREHLTGLVSKNAHFKDLVMKVSAVPDNLSGPDARAFAGRPFLSDQELIGPGVGGAPPKHGPVHFIGVYGNATPLQVKAMVGYPDVSVIRDAFGVYLWEQNTQIQLVFLTGCKTPQAVTGRLILFLNWLDSSGEYANMLKRAEARHLILTAVNEAKKITGS